MKSGKYWHYWDTCIFLHWLTDPKKDAAVVDGIEHIVRQVERAEAGVMTSVITRIEILRSRLPIKEANRFFKLFARPSMQQVNVDPRIAQLAHDIRDYYATQQPSVKLWTPDCIHLATAIAYGADEMNTLDGAGNRTRPGDLIALNENVMGGKYPIAIRKPLRKQASILAGVRPLEIAPRLIDSTDAEENASVEIAPGLRRRLKGSTSNEAGAEISEAEAAVTETDEVAPPVEPSKPSPASES